MPKQAYAVDREIPQIIRESRSGLVGRGVWVIEAAQCVRPEKPESIATMNNFELLAVAAFLAGVVASAVAGPSPDWYAAQEGFRKEQQAGKAKVAAEKAHACTQACACAEMKK